jgi:hypothetical protein
VRALFRIVLWLVLVGSAVGLAYVVMNLPEVEPQFVSRPALALFVWASLLVGSGILLWKLPRP